MPKRARGAVLAALPFLLGACSAVPATDTACRLERAMTLPLTRQHGELVVPVSIEGRPATMLVDTGADRTILSAGAVERLGLGRDVWRLTRSAGVGGEADPQQNAQLRFGLAGADVPSVSMAVTSLEFLDRRDPPVAGLLGADVLSRFDVELDLPRQRLNLWRATDCRRAYAAWQGRYAAVPLRRDAPNRLLLELRLDDRPVSALVDTGAERTTLTSWGAARLGVGEAELRNDPVGHGGGIGPRRFEVRLHRFRELAVGADRVADFPVGVGEFRMDGTQMLLGADYLGTRRVWLSYQHREMLVQTSAMAGSAALAGQAARRATAPDPDGVTTSEPAP